MLTAALRLVCRPAQIGKGPHPCERADQGRWARRLLERTLIDNVVLQPHHASGTMETRQAMGKLVRDNLKAYFAGAALTPVV